MTNPETKPRECEVWFIEAEPIGMFEEVHGDMAHLAVKVPMIELSAYEALQAELDNKNGAMTLEIHRLIEELAILRSKESQFESTLTETMRVRDELKIRLKENLDEWTECVKRESALRDDWLESREEIKQLKAENTRLNHRVDKLLDKLLNNSSNSKKIILNKQLK